MIVLAAYEKLKPYGFYVHGGIDGGTNFMVYITVTLNKSAAALFRGYRQAVATFGRPLDPPPQTRWAVIDASCARLAPASRKIDGRLLT